MVALIDLGTVCGDCVCIVSVLRVYCVCVVCIVCVHCVCVAAVGVRLSVHGAVTALYV
jgi:hypothetical protein